MFAIIFGQSSMINKENLRKSPNGEILGQLEAGIPIEIIETDGNWVRVTVSGYVWKPSISQKSVIGRWYDSHGIHHNIVIMSSGNDMIMYKHFNDGNSGKYPLTIKTIAGKKRLYQDPGNTFGDYMVIDARGNLIFYDSEGYIYQLVPKR